MSNIKAKAQGPAIKRVARRSLPLTILALTTTLLCSQSAHAQDVMVFSIADDIKAANDCTDQANQECRSLFENTCSWVGTSSITIRDGLIQSIPQDRILRRIHGEFIEIAEGSGGYVDIDLANSFVDPIWQYFISGQYETEFAHFSNQAGLLYGAMVGSTITGQSAPSEIDEAMRQINAKIDQTLTQKWRDTCMQTAYAW